jgi:hypothetical protein
MDRLVDKQLDHDDLLCRDAENEPVSKRQKRSDEEFADWLEARGELDYFLTH